jgi:uncharacterized protein YfaQ (DUF2300 family)
MPRGVGSVYVCWIKLHSVTSLIHSLTYTHHHPFTHSLTRRKKMAQSGSAFRGAQGGAVKIEEKEEKKAVAPAQTTNKSKSLAKNKKKKKKKR